jgi:hypothetical protein
MAVFDEEIGKWPVIHTQKTGDLPFLVRGQNAHTPGRTVPTINRKRAGGVQKASRLQRIWWASHAIICNMVRFIV